MWIFASYCHLRLEINRFPVNNFPIVRCEEIYRRFQLFLSTLGQKEAWRLRERHDHDSAYDTDNVANAESRHGIVINLPKVENKKDTNGGLLT